MTKVPIKTHGGKAYLAKQIIDLMPNRDNYTTLLETHAGGAAVLLQHDCHGKSEIINDSNGTITNFWKVLQNQELFEQFHRLVTMTPVSNSEFDLALPYNTTNKIEWAAQFFIRSRQSLTGRCKEFTSISTNRVRRDMNEQISAWLSAIEMLPEFHHRLIRVIVLNWDANKIIAKFDKPGVVMYCDPPYLHETRVSKNDYEHEMTTEQHEELLNLLTKLQHAKVLLSGYYSELYQQNLTGWYLTQFEIDNKSSMEFVKPKKIECVWTNYQPIPIRFSSRPELVGN